MGTCGYHRADGSTIRLLACLLACLLVLSGCGAAGAGMPDVGPTPAMPSAAASQVPTLDLARLATIAAQRPPGSPVTPVPLAPPATGPLCPAAGSPLTPVAAAPGSAPTALATPTAGAALRTFPGPCVDHRYDQPLGFAPDGRALALGGAAAVALYDPTSGRPIWTLPTPARPTTLAFAPDGASLAIGLAGGQVLLCRVADGSVARILDHPGRPYGGESWDAVATLAFSPDGRVLAGGYEQFVALWPLGGGEPIIRGLDPGVVGALAFEEGGAYLRAVQGSSLRNPQLPNVHRWSTSDWLPTASLAVPVIATTRLTGHGPTLATVTDAGVALWDLAVTPPTRRDMSAPGPFARALSLPQLAFSPRGDLLVGGTTSGGVYLWDVASATSVASYVGSARPITGVALAPDSATVAAVFADGTVCLWRR